MVFFWLYFCICRINICSMFCVRSIILSWYSFFCGRLFCCRFSILLGWWWLCSRCGMLNGLRSWECEVLNFKVKGRRVVSKMCKWRVEVGVGVGEVEGVEEGGFFFWLLEFVRLVWMRKKEECCGECWGWMLCW